MTSPNIDQIIRTNRKTIAIVIDRNGRLIVRVPKRASIRDINKFVNENTEWIQAKQKEVMHRFAELKPKEFIEGETFEYLGKSYTLKIVDRKRPALILNSHFELSKIELANAEHVFVEWYRERCREVVTARTEQFAKEFGFRYNRIRITSARTRWGSCGAKGGLNFTYRLVMAPIHVINYVVLHELLHTQIKNHSRDFWGELGNLMPDYKQRADWLRQYGYKLLMLNPA